MDSPAVKQKISNEEEYVKTELADILEGHNLA